MILPNFIVFEGIDGAGTTTQLKLLEKSIQEKNKKIKSWFTYEPTDLPTGSFLRNALKGDFVLSNKTMTRLFAADREEHLNGKDGIISKTSDGYLVFCDRYVFSTYAYQNEDFAYKENEGFPLPEHLFYFDISPKDSLSRIQKRDIIEIYEKEDFLNNVRDRYLKLIETYKEKEPSMKIHFITATDSKEKIHEKIWNIVQNMPTI